MKWLEDIHQATTRLGKNIANPSKPLLFIGIDSVSKEIHAQVRQFQVPSNGKSISINILSISVDRGGSMFLLCCQTGMPRRALLQGVVCIDKRNFYLSQKARLVAVV